MQGMSLFGKPNLYVEIIMQRESTASITEIPAKYVQESPPKAQQIIKIDCRGLEFTKFRADVWSARSICLL